MPTSTTPGIAVFDFDWSLIEQDSDYWTIHGLSPDIWSQVREKKDLVQWTDLMDWALLELQEKAGITQQDIVSILKKIPFSEAMLGLLRELKNRDIPVIIMSDANTFYIETILTAYGVRDCITEIITNPSYTDDNGYLRIRRLIPASEPQQQHHCPHPCSVNICKGREIDAAIQRYSQPQHIAYTGDGKNDFCPATRLRATVDMFFLRKEKSLDRWLVSSATEEEKNELKSQIVYWTNPKTVKEEMCKFFDTL